MERLLREAHDAALSCHGRRFRDDARVVTSQQSRLRILDDRLKYTSERLR